MTAVARCQNGWPALASSSRLLYTWEIPAKTGFIKVRLRNGSAGFILAHFLLWYAEKVEPLKGKVMDDWGYASRPIRGSETDLSNHAGGLAADHNATRHVLGKRGTFTKAQYVAIRTRLRMALYGGTLRHGINYHGRPDEMHVEIVAPLAYCERVAKRLAKTERGRRLLAFNSSQRTVIWS